MAGKTVRAAKTASDYVIAIRSLLAEDQIFAAREMAAEAVSVYPHDSELAGLQKILSLADVKRPRSEIRIAVRNSNGYDAISSPTEASGLR